MKNNLTLYQLSEKYLDDLSDLDLSDSEIETKLQAISADLEVKAINVTKVLKNLESVAESIKTAEESMRNRRKSLENRVEWLKNYLLENMQATNILNIECPEFRLSLRNNPPSVLVDNMDSIPAEYFDLPPLPDPKLNKSRVAIDLKNGVVIEGVKLVVNKSLQIK